MIAGDAWAPASGNPTQSALASIQAREFVVEGQGEAVRNIPRRGAVELMRIQSRRISAAVILGRRSRVRCVKEATFDSGSEVKGNAIVVCDAIILGIVDGAKTRIEARRSGIGWLADQIAWHGVDVHAIRNLTSRVAIPH